MTTKFESEIETKVKRGIMLQKDEKQYLEKRENLKFFNYLMKRYGTESIARNWAKRESMKRSMREFVR